MPGLIVIGIQWGDEGKGKIVDYFASQSDVVARFQGGNNAGHTLVVEGRQVILHLIPSGVLHPHTLCLIGSGVVVDPEVFLQEIEETKEFNLSGRVFLSSKCHLILDYHKALDGAREGIRKIGTTKRGIGPTYEDRASRRGIRIEDLKNQSSFKEKFLENIQEKNCLLKYYGASPLDPHLLMDKYLTLYEKLRPWVADVSQILYQEVKKNKKVLYEGAQGILLDVDFGTYPFVTSSHTLPFQAQLGLGAPLPEPSQILGVMKAYSTRVGEGPFPTELKGKMADHLRESGNEYGATTGRPRRCGWLDLAAVKYALSISATKHIAITKADILCGMDEVYLNTEYEDGSYDVTETSKPKYIKMPGWEKWDEVKSPNELPKNFLKYIEKIEDVLEVSISIVSTGPQRHQTLHLKDLGV